MKAWNKRKVWSVEAERRVVMPTNDSRKTSAQNVPTGDPHRHRWNRGSRRNRSPASRRFPRNNGHWWRAERIADSSEVGSYPNIHGDIVTTADGAGPRSSTVNRYDPFGQPIDPATDRIGTIAAADAAPNSQRNSEADYAWLGSNQKLFEPAGGISAIEMGARICIAAIGRFLSCDPIEGGVDTDYN